MAKVTPILRWQVPARSRGGVRMVHRLHADPAGERLALIAGLLAHPAAISPKYFYDALGCRLFEAICELPEYYPTRTERAILADNADDIARVAGRRKQWVDLGAGDCQKAELLLPAVRARRYVAVDIAEAAIEPALARLDQRIPGLELLGVVTDFSEELDLAGVLEHAPTIFFYPGSSIGNFSPSEAHAFLARVRALCGEDSGLLIGVDTKKDVRRLEAAYDDALGVTAAFNRNVLNHVNAILGSDFDPGGFTHRAHYNEAAGRIEMHLEAHLPQPVHIGGRERFFRAGEKIHTENSYKYTPDEFTRLLSGAGFETRERWQDGNGAFAVFYAE